MQDLDSATTIHRQYIESEKKTKNCFFTKPRKAKIKMKPHTGFICI